MSTSFNSKVQAVLDRMDPASARLIQSYIEDLRNHGLYSFSSLLEVVRAASDMDLRVTACWLLGRLDDRRALDTLIAALQEADLRVVEEAAKSLGMLGSRKALQPLIELLIHSGAPENRKAAAYALGLLHDKRAFEPLLRMLMNSQEAPQVRGYAAEALASLKDRRASPALMAALEDPSVEVRFWCVFALGQLQESRALPLLERLVEKDASILPGWGTIAQEAADAMDSIKKAASRS